jgi:hypothetical protein
MNHSSKYAMTLVMAIGIAAIKTAAVSTTTFSAYADGGKGGNGGGCSEEPKNDNPNFNELVTRGASESTGNPHTCEQQTGDPHDDPDNPEDGNPHNTDDDDDE